LFKKAFKYLSQKDIDAFRLFLEAESSVLEAKKIKSNFPIAKAMQPIIGAPCAFAGSQIGYIVGAALSEKNTFAASMIISSMTKRGYIISAMPGTYVSAVILVPAITSRILSTFSGISLSWAAGSGLGLIGEGLGFSVGMSLDLSLLAIKGTCKTLLAITRLQEKNDLPSGLRLTDGHNIQHGIDLHNLESITFKQVSLDVNNLPQIKMDYGIKIEEVGQQDEQSWLLAST
jgi:hypothetical protein